MTAGPFLDTYARYPVEVVRGEGCRVLGADGRWYLDAIAGIGVMALGHGHPAVTRAIHEQVDRLLHVSNLYSVPVQTAFAERLSALYGGGSVFLCNSGAEAVEAAVKLARKHHHRRGDPRPEVLSVDGAFHGRTFMALALTPKPKFREGYEPFPDEVRSVPADALPGAIADRTAAVIVEPVRGEGGCLPVENLAEIRAAADRAGALLVYDEIQCGLGRTGQLRHSPEPDVTCLAKALGGGLPLGAIVARPDLSGAFQPGDHGSTFGGNPVACAAGLATLDVIVGQDLPARCASLGARLRAGLEAAGARVTGRGLMLAAWTDAKPATVVDRMRHRGVLVCPAGDGAVRFLPPFVASEADVDEMTAAFAGAIRAAGGEREGGRSPPLA